MKMDLLTKQIGAASLATALLFTGNTWMTRMRTTAPEEPLATVALAETLQTEPMPTEPDEKTLACAQIGAQADGRHMFVYDVGAGEMVWCNTDAQDKLYPASITKLYASLVGLMYLQPDTVVTAGEELGLVHSDSSRAYLSRDCRITVKMLVEGMLVPSGSDASYVFAAAAGRAIAGDENLAGKEAVAVFIEEMNRKGEELGLQNSHFVNPDGYHEDDHYMCPADVARVAALAWEEPIIAEYMAVQQDSVRFASGQTITWYNNNLLMDPTSACYSDSAVGMKTGFTSQAGNCLLAAFRQGASEIIVGIFGSEEKYPRYESALAFFKACV